MKKTNNKIIIITGVLIIAAVILCTCFFLEGNKTVKCETDIYSVSVPARWDIKIPSDDCKIFMTGSDKAASIEIFRDCSYCTSAESIVANAFGMHSSLANVEETVLGEWTRYKMVIDNELSPAEQEKGGTEAPSELHYIYTNKENMFVDIYINQQLLSDKQIQKIIDSFEINHL